jgi:hypothetical protein
MRCRFLINGNRLKSSCLYSSKSPGAEGKNSKLMCKIPWNCLTSTGTYQKIKDSSKTGPEAVFWYTVLFLTDPEIRSRIPICLFILSSQSNCFGELYLQIWSWIQQISFKAVGSHRDVLIYGYGSADPYHWITDPDLSLDTALFFSGFQDTNKKQKIFFSFFAYYGTYHMYLHLQISLQR